MRIIIYNMYKGPEALIFRSNTMNNLPGATTDIMFYLCMGVYSNLRRYWFVVPEL